MSDLVHACFRALPGWAMLSRVAGLAALSLWPILAAAQQPSPRFELLHLWVVDQEAHALRAISDPMKKSGVVWSENQVATNFLGVRDIFADRLALGAPPGGLFWLGGDQHAGMYDEQFFRLIPNRVGDLSFSEELIPEVYENVRADDSITLLPLGIHLQNRMIYNQQVLDRLGLPLPKTWQELLDIAPILSENGVYAVAMSDERWQIRFLLTSILAEQFSADEMYDFLENGVVSAQVEDRVRHTARIFMALRDHALPATRDLRWASVIELVKKGDALATFMGDFAAPLIADQDRVRCGTPPGNQYVVWSFDTIALVATDDPDVIAGQDRLIEQVLQHRTHDEYILRKGGVPVYRGLDTSLMDACSQASLRAWNDSEDRLLLAASEWTQSLDTMASIMRIAWRDPSVDADTLAGELLAAIDLTTKGSARAVADR